MEVNDIDLTLERVSELKEISSFADDITEPACMEKVLMYLDQLKIDDESFMQLLLDRLPDMLITWEQPWYQQTNSLTRPLSKNINIDDNSDTFRTDTICKEENMRIEKNWRKFRRRYGLPDMLICFARWKNKDKSRTPRTPEERVRHFVTAFLAQGLKRNLYQVYKHILTYYGSPVKGQYSETEEIIMEICFHHAPSKAVTYLTVVLGREPRGIYKRLHQLYNGKSENKPIRKWTLPKATELLKSLMQHSGCSLENLKNKTIPKSVWLDVESDMDIPYIYLQTFWVSTLHTQLFVKFYVKLKKLRRKIFKKIRSYSHRVWSDIRWKEILKQFPDGFTHYFLYRVCYSIVKTLPNYRNAPLDDVIKYCLNRNKSSRFSHRLKTLALDKDGNLEQVKYDQKIEY